MNETQRELLGRAQRAIQEAEALLGAGHRGGVVNRAYFAAFYAAVAAIRDTDTTSSRHSRIISEFGRRFGRDPAFEGHRATLKVLEDRRKLADYSEADTTTAELAAELVALARSFIDTVAGRLAASPDSSS